MILEVADIRIPPGKNAEFDAALARGLASVVSRAKGYLRHRVVKGIESPERYLLMIWWETLEDHTEGFRKSAGYEDRKALLHHFYDPFPTVEHFSVVATA